MSILGFEEILELPFPLLKHWLNKFKKQLFLSNYLSEVILIILNTTVAIVGDNIYFGISTGISMYSRNKSF